MLLEASLHLNWHFPGSLLLKVISQSRSHCVTFTVHEMNFSKGFAESVFELERVHVCKENFRISPTSCHHLEWTLFERYILKFAKRYFPKALYLETKSKWQFRFSQKQYNKQIKHRVVYSSSKKMSLTESAQLYCHTEPLHRWPKPTDNGTRLQQQVAVAAGQLVDGARQQVSCDCMWTEKKLILD